MNVAVVDQMIKGSSPFAARNQHEDNVSDYTDWSLVRIGSVILRRRALVAALAVLGALAAVVPSILRPRTFTSTAVFLLQNRRQPANLGGLAAQLGLQIPVDGGQSPQLYADLLKSPELLAAAVDSRYAYAARDGQFEGTLVDAMRPNGQTRAFRREAAIRDLRDRVDASVAAKTGSVTLSVTADNPYLAAQMGDRLLSLLSDFNVRTRQSQAKAERVFSETRMRESLAELQVAEGRLQAFLERNRDYRNSPSLVFQHDRLSREVELRQQLYTLLAQSSEQARMEEVRDTPVITIIQPARPPLRPDPRGLITKAFLGLLIGGTTAVGLSILLAYRERIATLDPAGYTEFNTLWLDATRGVRKPLRGLRALFGRGRRTGARPIDPAVKDKAWSPRQ